ncbi:hypothetical protein ACH4SZ_35110, partial [Streptomyces exfoliatus]
MTVPSLAQRLANHVQYLLGSGPFPQPGGWTHMGAVICDVSFQPRCNYEATLRPRLLRLQMSWPDARTVRGFQGRLATEDLAVAMKFNHAQKVATAHAITDLLGPVRAISVTRSTGLDTSIRDVEQKPDARQRR